MGSVPVASELASYQLNNINNTPVPLILNKVEALSDILCIQLNNGGRH